MPSRSFALTATVAAPPERVIDFLMRLDGHRGIHPYLQSAVVVSEGTGDEGPWWDWQVTERPAAGPLRYTIRFPARMSRLTPTAMRGHVRAAPGCRLDTVTRATGTTSGTIVEETTVVTAPWPLLGYMAKHARLAHERTFRMLSGELDRAA